MLWKIVGGDTVIETLRVFGKLKSLEGRNF